VFAPVLTDGGEALIRWEPRPQPAISRELPKVHSAASVLWLKIQPWEVEQDTLAVRESQSVVTRHLRRGAR
jgi:hypothetical protein